MSVFEKKMLSLEQKKLEIEYHKLNLENYRFDAKYGDDVSGRAVKLLISLNSGGIFACINLFAVSQNFYDVGKAIYFFAIGIALIMFFYLCEYIRFVDLEVEPDATEVEKEKSRRRIKFFFNLSRILSIASGVSFLVGLFKVAMSF